MTAPSKPVSRRSLLPITIAALAALVVLVSLGFWQLARLEWKEDLIATLSARVDAPPVSLAEAVERARDAAAEADWLRVRVPGQFLTGPELYVYATVDGRPGWRAVAPFRSESGLVVLVDRGFVPDALYRVGADVPLPPREPVVVTGLVRTHGEGRSLFTPENEPGENRWYWWDIPAMVAELRLAREAAVIGFVVEAEPGPWQGEGRWPEARKREPVLPNRHLEYALTWFGLALCLVGVYIALVRSRLQGDRHD